MEHRSIRSIGANRHILIAAIAVLLVATFVAVVASNTGHKVRSASADVGGLGQLSGLLPRNQLTTESAIQWTSATRRCACHCTKGKRMARQPGSSFWMPRTPGWRMIWA